MKIPVGRSRCVDFPHCPPLGGVIWDKNDLLGVTHAACNMLGFVGLLRPEAPKFIPHFKIYKVYSEISCHFSGEENGSGREQVSLKIPTPKNRSRDSDLSPTAWPSSVHHCVCLHSIDNSGGRQQLSPRGRPFQENISPISS